MTIQVFPRRHPWWSAALLLLTLIALAACQVRKELPIGPIATEYFEARVEQAEPPLVIVLPGIEDDMGSLKSSGIVGAIQSAMPQADVLLAVAVYGYYLDHSLLERLQNEIVQPEIDRGRRRIWIAGASLGGMGALLYEREHPGLLSGLVLMAPFTGREGLTDEIQEAGGLDRWQPGPRPSVLSPDNVPHELWRLIKEWGEQPEQAARVWLISGDKDKFRPAAELISEVLPDSHYLVRPGGHRWSVWSPAAREVFARIAAESDQSTSRPPA